MNTTELPLPEKIFPVEYAGFFDFNEEGIYDISVINRDDYPNAEQIANEIAKRYNNFNKMKEALLKASKLLQAAAIEAQRPEVEKYLSGGYRQTLENAVFKDSLGIEQLLESLK